MFAIKFVAAITALLNNNNLPKTSEFKIGGDKCHSLHVQRQYDLELSKLGRGKVKICESDFLSAREACSTRLTRVKTELGVRQSGDKNLYFRIVVVCHLPR